MLFLTIKFLCFLINRDELKACLEYFDQKFVTVRTIKQRKITDECVTVCRNFCNAFFIGALVAWIMWIATVRFQDYCLNLPLELWSTFSCDSQPTLYFCVYSTCILGGYKNDLFYIIYYFEF